MPNIREKETTEIIENYLNQVKEAKSEPAKSTSFTLLLNNLFSLQPHFIDEYIKGIEKYVRIRKKDTILRGRIDNLFGSLIIEFERDLLRSEKEAEGQLKIYLSCLWSNEFSQKVPYLCLATDGIHFNVYSPSLQDWEKKEIEREDIILNLIEEVDLTTLKPLDVYFWLDKYLLRKEILPPTTEKIIRDFGVKSHAFQTNVSKLLYLWERVKDKSAFKTVYNNWRKYLRIVYGSEVADEELFCRHTYLANLAKLIAWRRMTAEKVPINDYEIPAILLGEYFEKQGIENFLEEDFFSWVAREEASEMGVKIFRTLLNLLATYNLREISEDVFKSLYQELVDPKTRHDLGEFYTPDWLAHKMVRKLMEENPEGKFLDPACGSGTFLYLTIKEKRND